MKMEPNQIRQFSWVPVVFALLVFALGIGGLLYIAITATPELSSEERQFMGMSSVIEGKK